jgi:hypothetical protein
VGVPAVKRAALLLGLCGIAHAARPDTSQAELFHYSPGDVVEAFASAGGNFSIHFTRAGKHAVPLDDTNTNGTPDFVESAAAVYESSLTFYKGLGFRAPLPDGASTPNGGDAKTDVYLLDFGGSSDGSFRREGCDMSDACTGYLVHENDFAGYGYPTLDIGNKILASHELFHAVQAAYKSGQGSIVDEGTAVWATEKFDPSLTDFEQFIKGYLSRPDRSLDKPLPDPVDPFSYGSAIFFQFLDERFGDQAIKNLWDETARTGAWFTSIDSMLASKYQSSFAEAYAEFARWNLYTGPRANPAVSYDRGSGYPLVRIDASTLPLTQAELRIFPAASLYLGMAPGGRAQVSARIFPPEGVTGLRLVLVTRKGNTISPPVLADSDRATIDASGADQVIVLISNTAQSGESTKPGVCVGDADEVATCAAELGPPPPPPPPPSGCAVSGRPNAPSLLLLALLAVPLRRRAGRTLLSLPLHRRSCSRCRSTAERLA